MKARLNLLWPWLCAVGIIAMVALPRVVEPPAEAPVQESCCGTESGGAENGGAEIDLVCSMEVARTISATLDGKDYYFCTGMCREAFLENPAPYLGELCLVCKSDGKLVPVAEGAPEATWQENTYRFCDEEHRASFRADAAGYFLHTMWGIPGWLYYGSIAFLMLISFGALELRSGKARTALLEAPPRPRFDLLRCTWLRKLLKWPALRATTQAVCAAFFLLIVAAGLFGSQLPGRNLAPLLTWTVWWCGLVLLILFLGKAWCYICPWDGLATWFERLRFYGNKPGLSLGLKWPRAMRNIWPASLLFIGLTWVELGFGVTQSPRATAWMALVMFGLAFVCAFLFEKKSFCRYGCLIGRISGLYALFSPIEVRATDQKACLSCKTKSCYKGNADGEACPTGQYLGRMAQNTYCISCMECVKTCEKDNVSINLRPWGEDLIQHAKPRSDEAYLALLMLALTGFHGLTMTKVWRDLTASLSAELGQTLAFSAGMVAIIALPIAAYAGLVWLGLKLAGGKVDGREYFIRYAYALLPIALFYHLAHNAEHLLMEGQKLIVLLSDPFGWNWNLLGTADWRPAPLVDLPTLWLIQVVLVMVGHLYSLWVARKTAGALFSDRRSALKSQLPMLAAMILFSLLSLWLLKQPMEMRTSAM